MARKSTNAANPADAENQALNQTPPQSGEEIGDECVPKFTKEQLLKSTRYSHRRDVLNSLLEDSKMYSHATVERLISSFMKGKVN